MAWQKKPKNRTLRLHRCVVRPMAVLEAAEEVSLLSRAGADQSLLVAMPSEANDNFASALKNISKIIKQSFFALAICAAADIFAGFSIAKMSYLLARYPGLSVLIPSSIAAFGPETPRDNTPQETVLKPRTMYGVTKVAGELLSDYYFHRFGLDVRGLRYPGIISSETPPGGGTTDFAVEIFYEAIKHGKYTCFVREDTRLPMMYMPDCLDATLQLMEADLSKLKHHSDFNLTAMSFSAARW